MEQLNLLDEVKTDDGGLSCIDFVESGEPRVCYGCAHVVAVGECLAVGRDPKTKNEC